MISTLRRPKLLFLALDVPPVQSIGSVRTWNIVKHLARLGWDVTVVTPEPAVFLHIENEKDVRAAFAAEGIRKILTDHRLRFLDPSHLVCWNQNLGWFFGGIGRSIARRLGVSRRIGWIKPAEKVCDSIRPEDVDLILASGPPFSAFVLAERLSKKLARPYILDYRDPWWTEIPNVFSLCRPVVKRLERRLVTGATAINVVSPSWELDMDSQFKVGSKLHVITNGYDPEDLVGVTPTDFGHFAIVYAGIFYPPERVITPILRALKRLKLGGKTSSCYFHYYGEHDRHVSDEAARLDVTDLVKLHGLVPRSEALSAIKGSSVAVVITSVFEKASAGISGWIPGKLFEIIGLGSPILLISPPGSDAESVSNPTGLVRRFTGNDIDGIVSFFEEVMSGPTFGKKQIEAITWECLGKKLDRILRNKLTVNIRAGVSGVSSPYPGVQSK